MLSTFDVTDKTTNGNNWKSSNNLIQCTSKGTTENSLEQRNVGNSLPAIRSLSMLNNLGRALLTDKMAVRYKETENLAKKCATFKLRCEATQKWLKGNKFKIHLLHNTLNLFCVFARWWPRTELHTGNCEVFSVSVNFVLVVSSRVAISFFFFFVEKSINIFLSRKSG